MVILGRGRGLFRKNTKTFWTQELCHHIKTEMIVPDHFRWHFLHLRIIWLQVNQTKYVEHLSVIQKYFAAVNIYRAILPGIFTVDKYKTRLEKFSFFKDWTTDECGFFLFLYKSKLKSIIHRLVSSFFFKFQRCKCCITLCSTFFHAFSVFAPVMHSYFTDL